MKTRLAAYTAAEAARELDVAVATIYRWLDEGRLHELTTRGGNARLVDAASVERMKDEA